MEKLEKLLERLDYTVVQGKTEIEISTVAPGGWIVVTSESAWYA